MKKIGILGGTFDPVHIAHINIAYEAMYNLKLDKVIFMVSGNPPHKDKGEITDAKLRFQLVKNAIKEEIKFEASDYEINKHSQSYTYKTLEYLNQYYKDDEIYFITGADCLIDLHKWCNVKAILDNCKFVVFKRPGYLEKDIKREKEAIEKKYNTKIIYLNIPILEISSTYIREKIRKNENVSYLTPRSVYEDIVKNHLYKGE